MWATRIVRCVGLLLDPLIPVVSIAIQRTDPVTIDADVVAAKDESRGLILVTDRKGCVEPVLDVSAPLRST
jgi:hypothetical protein